MSFQTLVDNTTTPGYTYICQSDLGFNSSEARWKITRVDDNGNTFNWL